MRPRIIDAAPWLVLGVGLLVWTGLMVHLVRGLWFTGDDFDFLMHRSLTFKGDYGLLVPHNEHWSTLPILLFRLNFALFGLHHYLPYGLMPVACHLLACVLIYVILRRSGVGPWVSSLVALAAVFLAGGAGWENTLWDFQVGFLGSCLLGLVALALFVTGRWGRPGHWLGVLALILSLMSSGMGIVMVVWSGLYLFLRDGLRTAFLTVLAPAAVYVAWYAGWGHGHRGSPPGQASDAPQIALRGLGNIWTAALGLPEAGPVMLAVMILVVSLRGHTDRLFALAASGLGTVVAAYFLFGYTRSGMGPGATMVSRYAYFGVVLTLPALAAGLQMASANLASRPARVGAAAWMVTGALVVAVGAAEVSHGADDQRTVVSANRAGLVAAARLVESGAPLLRELPLPLRNPDITATVLRKASIQAALPRAAPGQRAMLEVAANLQVDVSGQQRSLPPAVGISWHGFEPRATQGPDKTGQQLAGCVTRKAVGAGRLEVPLTDASAQLRISVSGSALETGLVSGQVRTPLTRWPTQPRQELYVATTARAATLEIVVPAGEVTVCTG